MTTGTAPRSTSPDSRISIRRVGGDGGRGGGGIPRNGNCGRDLEPLDLRRHARETTDILESPRFTPPKAEVEGLWENPERYAQQIRDALTPFQTTLDEIEAQKREVEIALQAKTERLDELHERLKWSIRFFEAIYQLAGQGFHAERLRLTVPARPSGEEPADDEPEPDAEEPQPDTPEPSEPSG